MRIGPAKSNHNITFDLQGTNDLIRDLRSLLPSEKVSRFTLGWARIVKATIQAKAPKKSGDLRRGIVVSPRPEQSKIPGKAVWDIWFDAAYNETFVKTTKSGKRYYYPASQNYGFDVPKRTTVPGAPPGRNHVPGIYFMQEGLADVAPSFIAASQSLMDEVTKNG